MLCLGLIGRGLRLLLSRFLLRRLNRGPALGLAFELPDAFADATPALQFRSNSIVSVTGRSHPP